jgi:SAM-dependent methyltransferase
MPSRKKVRLARASRPRVYQGPAAHPATHASTTDAEEQPVSDDWGLIARIYDLEQPSCRGPELAFWCEAAAAARGDVLELAAGSGRVAIALARKGFHVTGLELSAGMLDRARRRTAHLPPETRARLTWVQGDMARFDLPGRRFGLIFIAFNSFWLLADPAAQRACLACVARHLAPGGRLVLNLFPPNQSDYRDEFGIVQYVPAQRHGVALLRFKDYHYDAERHLAISDVRYYRSRSIGEPLTHLVTKFRYCLRLAEPSEVQALLAEAGYEVVATYGTYDRQPLTPDTPHAIFVAQPLDPLTS